MNESCKPLEEMTKEEVIEKYRTMSRNHMEALAELSHLRKIIPPHLQEVPRLRDGVIQLMVMSEIDDEIIAQALDTTSSVVSRVRRAMGVKKNKGRPPKH